MIRYQTEKEDLEKRLNTLKDSQISETMKSSFEKIPRQSESL